MAAPAWRPARAFSLGRSPRSLRSALLDRSHSAPLPLVPKTTGGQCLGKCPLWKGHSGPSQSLHTARAAAAAKRPAPVLDPPLVRGSLRNSRRRRNSRHSRAGPRVPRPQPPPFSAPRAFSKRQQHAGSDRHGQARRGARRPPPHRLVAALGRQGDRGASSRPRNAANAAFLPIRAGNWGLEGRGGRRRAPSASCALTALLSGALERGPRQGRRGEPFPASATAGAAPAGLTRSRVRTTPPGLPRAGARRDRDRGRLEEDRRGAGRQVSAGGDGPRAEDFWQRHRHRLLRRRGRGAH